MTTIDSAFADALHGRYELGRGGMAAVFLADDLRHDRSRSSTSQIATMSERDRCASSA